MNRSAQTLPSGARTQAGDDVAPRQAISFLLPIYVLMRERRTNRGGAGWRSLAITDCIV
jgi:hypothetical protein